MEDQLQLFPRLLIMSVYKKDLLDLPCSFLNEGSINRGPLTDGLTVNGA